MKSVQPVLRHGDSPLVTSVFGGEGYEPLYGLRGQLRHGMVTSRFRLSWRERISILFGGCIWLQQLTFGNGYAPVQLHASEPDFEECL